MNRSLILNLRSIYYWLPSLLLLGLIFSEWLVIMYFNKGIFSYTLDDPYIHLSLAKHIGMGHYGLNQGEFSSPSSSILWPFLLVPFSSYEYSPLVLNTLFSLGTLWVFITLSLYANEKKQRDWTLFLLFFLLIPALNLVGLIYSGMEHSLHMLLSVLLVSGLISESRDNRCPFWLCLVIILGSLIRYESLALSIPCLVFLFYRGHYKKSLCTLVTLSISLCLFSAFLMYLGQPPIAASILNKMSFSPDVSFIAKLINQLQRNLMAAQSFSFIAYLGGFLALVFFSRIDKVDKQLVIVMVASLLLHMFWGKFDWFYRYELYLHAAAWLLLLYLYFTYVPKQQKSYWYVVLIISLVMSSTPYFRALTFLPKAANNIFSQHYQMRRFVLQWVKSPVVVNDIGWLSYNNPYYVLDLWGLGNYQLYKERIQQKNADWMAKATDESHAKLAMIYKPLFPKLPSNWRLLGCLYMKQGPQLSLGDTRVYFYATQSLYYSELKEQLLDFSKRLPSTAEFKGC
jgi:hypothetical protein